MEDAIAAGVHIDPPSINLMAPERDETLRPVGPGRGPAEQRPDGDRDCPPFELDPAAWFDWVDGALVRDSSQLVGATRACAWSDARGRPWRVVVTAEGPEVRPALGSPFLPHDLPIIGALLVTPGLIHVELAWSDAKEVAHVPAGQVRVADLGVAMLTGTELPHAAVVRVGADTWERARKRWQTLLGELPQPVS